MDPIEYREGDEHATQRKLNGLNKYANITLKRGITDSTEIADWHPLVVDGATLIDDARGSVFIRVGNKDGEARAAFEIVKAWPCKYDPSDLNATGNESAVGILVLQLDSPGGHFFAC